MGETIADRLAKDGWHKRSTASEPRLSEIVKMYEELDFEVRLEPVDLDDLHGAACAECFLVQSGRFFTIYTRSSNLRI